jgi:hypothetical protein
MAGQPSMCDAVLILNVGVAHATDDMRMALLQTISEESYSRVKAAGAAGLSIPGTVDFSGNYAHFDEQRKAYFEQMGYSTERNVALDTVRSFVRPDQVEAWEKCMREQHGFHCFRVSSDDQSVTVEFSWNPPPGTPLHGIVDATVIGGTSTLSGAPAGQAFPPGYMLPNGSRQVVFHRQPGQPFVLSANFNIPDGAYSDEVRLPGRHKYTWAAINASQFSAASNMVKLDNGAFIGAPVPDQPSRFYVPLPDAPNGIAPYAELYMVYSSAVPTQIRVAVVGDQATAATIQPTAVVRLGGSGGVAGWNNRQTAMLGNIPVKEGTNYVVIATDQGSQMPLVNAFWLEGSLELQG